MLTPGACRPGAPAQIGDGYPRDSVSEALLESFEPDINQAGITIVRWSVAFLGQTIQLNTEQAGIFADIPPLVAVVGHSGSRDALLAAAVYNARRVPHVVPNATSRKLSLAGPWTFTLVPNDAVEGEFIARYALDSLRATRIAVFYLGDEYGIGLRDGIHSALQARRSNLVDATVVPSTSCLLPMNATIYRSVVTAAIQRSKPDAVVLATGVQGWCVADVVHSINPDIWLVAADGMDGAQHVPAGYLRVVPERLRGVAFWTPGADSTSRDFVERTRRRTHRDPTASDALQFDAYMLLVAAIREAGPDRTAIRAWLESLGRTRPAWSGITGPVAFNQPRSGILRMLAPVDSPE